VKIGVRLGVVSNKNGRFLREEVQHLGWTGHFDRVVGATDAPADKPSPTPVLLVLQTINIAPGETVWLVGDAPVDVECAMNAGCAPVLLRNEPPREGEFAQLSVLRHFVRCDELTHLVRELLVPISPN
jgi:phosphoglycolate phosphatase